MVAFLDRPHVEFNMVMRHIPIGASAITLEGPMPRAQVPFRIGQALDGDLVMASPPDFKAESGGPTEISCSLHVVRYRTDGMTVSGFLKEFLPDLAVK